MTLNYDLTHDLDPSFSRSNFEKVITQEWDAWSTWNERDVSRLNVGPMLQLWPHPWPGPWIFNVKFWNCCIPGMAGSINMEQKGCESIGCYTYFVTLSYDLDLGFSRSNFKNAVSREWEADWHGTKGMWVDKMLFLLCGLELWLWPWILKVKF